MFREGKRLIKEGKLAEGCAKLEASDRIETSTGTLLNLGDCREQNKQLASAWAAFLKAATTAKAGNDKKREAEARRRAKVLEPKLAHLTITVKTKLDGMTVSRDGAPLEAGAWGSQFPIDAGTYKIEATAPGYEPWSGEVHIVDGADSELDVPELVKSKAPPPPVEKPIVAPKPVEASPAQPASRFTTMRKVSIGLAAVGLVTLGIGVKFGLDARSESDDSDKICPMSACSDQHAIDLNDDAKHHAKLANISFGIGGAAIVGAAVLWFVGAPHETITVTPNSVAIGGQF